MAKHSFLNRVIPIRFNNLLKLYVNIIHQRWRIIYKIDKKRVYILLIADSSRNLEDILFQRLIKQK